MYSGLIVDVNKKVETSGNGITVVTFSYQLIHISIARQLLIRYRNG